MCSFVDYGAESYYAWMQNNLTHVQFTTCKYIIIVCEAVLEILMLSVRSSVSRNIERMMIE